MRLGVCTTDFPRMRAQALFDKIAAFGFGCAQFSFAQAEEADPIEPGVHEMPARVSKAVIHAVREGARAAGVSLRAINGTFNMAHPDPAVREEGLRRLSLAIEAAGELDVGIVTLCTGTRNTSHLWRPSPLNHTREAWNDMRDTVGAAVRLAEAGGVTLAIETEASNVVDTPERARRLLSEMGSRHLKIIMDCANLFRPGMARSDNVRPTIEHAFNVLEGEIVLAHGKDIRASEGIEFCPTGEGIVDYPFFLEKLDQAGYRGDMILHGIFSEDAMRRAVAFMRGLGGIE